MPGNFYYVKHKKTLVFLLILILLQAASPQLIPECKKCGSGDCVYFFDTESKCAGECYASIWETAHCVYSEFDCSSYDTDCSSQSRSNVMCSVLERDGKKDDTDCFIECAASCGKATTYRDKCEENCKTYCKDYAGKGDAESVCYRTCYGTCEANKEFCAAIILLRMYAMFAAVIMIMLQGYRWMVSDDVEGRIEARRSIAYILFGLIFIAAASFLVNLILNKNVICI